MLNSYIEKTNLSNIVRETLYTLMISHIRTQWHSLSLNERVLSLLVLIFCWGGIAAAILLSQAGMILDAGGFFWGCILGSCTLSYLSFRKRKRDVVSLLTPLYAIIIFMGLEIPPTILLQVLFAGTLTVILCRLHAQFT